MNRRTFLVPCESAIDRYSCKLMKGLCIPESYFARGVLYCVSDKKHRVVFFI